MAKGSKETVILISTLAISMAVIGAGFLLLRQNQGSENPVALTTNDRPNNSGNSSPNVAIEERISTGEQVLFTDTVTAEKQSGVISIATGNYENAIDILQASLNKNRNDPEALVYLNNARAKQSGNVLKIAASLPISSSSDAAKEILRGIAHAQNQVNQTGGINGALLEVAIADDQNEAQTAQEVAAALAQDPQVLAVVGSFGSGTTIAAAEVYQAAGLVQISPTSTSTTLSTAGNYIFRTVPSDLFAANALAKYAIEDWQVTKAAVFYNSESNYSKSLKDGFTGAFVGDGGEVVWEVDLAAADFNAAAALNQARDRGAQTIMLAANSATLSQAFEVIAINSQNLLLLGGDSLYRRNTLATGGQNAVGMILAVPWHILGNPNSKFPSEAAQLWGGDVNWRTAMAYDATEAIVTALRQSPTRDGVQQALASTNFAATGADAEIYFQPSGDRNRAPILVRVVKAPADNPRGRSGTGYDFVPLEAGLEGLE
ncbi:amino acid/amide ABC transporter substrate-binding protein, HAAT family [Thalassoporum mexicanum PCC 7367]|uniref:ABC transporter substrate-binding protein n=1 Tax=Thalassoporum mexicanum TaxID=3457544 RepID=UPI00029F9D93|nr:ABC transporter substrate-binding protein [Pseudanabaena sp. PCC 7367]AFY68335.1 amino acid/amide ABC transporter substrate-binding protein, HAAT family [Pseudanabaena sp. PCC 7367]